jgi:hypothetical protein
MIPPRVIGEGLFKTKTMTEKKYSPLDTKGKTRKQQIKNCPQCGGKPDTVDFELDGLVGKRCSKGNCLLVVSWEKKES